MVSPPLVPPDHLSSSGDEDLTPVVAEDTVGTFRAPLQRFVRMGRVSPEITTSGVPPLGGYIRASIPPLE